MIDLASLPSQPGEDSASEGTPSETPQIVPAVWGTLSDEQKAVHLQSMIVACVDGIFKNNPTLWIWVPLGELDDFTRLWIDSMTRQLGGDIKTDDAVTQLYFPEVKEHAEVSVPSLYTRDMNVGNDLLKFTRELAKLGDVDLNTIHEQVGLDVASMKGLLLFWRIGRPAMFKQLENVQKLPKDRSPGGIILPGG